MSLRSEWHSTKDLSKFQFKKENPLTGDVHKGEGITAYPVKFKDDLGPTLDDWEKAKKANKATDQLKHKNKALGIIGEYRKEINNAAKLHGHLSGTLLTNELAKIETALNHG